MQRRVSTDVNQLETRVFERGAESARELDCSQTVAAGGLMATPILGRTGNPFLFVAYALIALSLWTVDREFGGRSSQPSIISTSDTAGDGGSQHGETSPSLVLPQSDKFYRPASSVLEQLAADGSSSAEDDYKDHDKHRAAIALMVYLATDGIRR